MWKQILLYIEVLMTKHVFCNVLFHLHVDCGTLLLPTSTYFFVQIISPLNRKNVHQGPEVFILLVKNVLSLTVAGGWGFDSKLEQHLCM